VIRPHTFYITMALEILAIHPSQPRDWTQTVDEYLASNGIQYTAATPLAGGHSAYVWRIDGYFKNNNNINGRKNHFRPEDPCILKYAEEVCKGAPQMKLDAKRMRFEARALRSAPVARACEVEPSVRVPRVLETMDHALLMSWGGEEDLRSAYINQRAFDAGKVGSRIGRWLASMHIAGLNDEEVRHFENDCVESAGAVEHKILREAMLKDGLRDEEADAAIMVLRSPAGPKTLVAWDFRPMNTLLSFGRSDCDREPGVTIVDWECSAYSCPVADLRLWTAEALVLEASHGTCSSMVPSFLGAYRQQAGDIVTEDFICKLAISVGSTLLFLVPTGLWVSETTQMEFWKIRAMQFIRAGLKRDMIWLAASEFAPLM